MATVQTQDVNTTGVLDNPSTTYLPVQPPPFPDPTPVPQGSTPTTTSPVVADPNGVLGSSTVKSTVPTYDTTGTATTFMNSQPTSAQTNAQYISPEATISGQMSSLLNSNSPWMKVAETRANERANKAGLLSSSMAVGASQRAAIEQALPVATGDAATYAKSNLANQDLMNQSVLSGQTSNQAMQQQDQNFQNQSALQRQGANEALVSQGMDTNSKMQLEQYSQQAANYRAQLDANVKIELQNSSDSTQMQQQKLSAVQSLGSTFENQYSAILNSNQYDSQTSREQALNALSTEHQKLVSLITGSFNSDINFNPDNSTTTGSSYNPGTTGTDLTGIYYKDLVNKPFESYKAFDTALSKAGGKSSDDFNSLTSSMKYTIPEYTTTNGDTTKTIPSKTITLSPDQQWDVYSKVMYAALNPTFEQAQKDAMNAVLVSSSSGSILGGGTNNSLIQNITVPNDSKSTSPVAAWISNTIQKPLYNTQNFVDVNGNPIKVTQNYRWVKDGKGGFTKVKV